MIKTVLLIDDDLDDLELMKEAISEIDKSIVTISFQNLEEALIAVTEHLLVRPDYIFIDVNMPLLSCDKV